MSVRAKPAARKSPRRVAKKPATARKPTHKPPKKREPGMVARDWATFGQRLASALDAMSESQYLVLAASGSARFVQFAQQGKWGVRAECVSNEYLVPEDRLTPANEEALQLLGWHAPTLEPLGTGVIGNDPDGSPNWFADFPRPVEFEALADLVIRTFTQVYKVRHPSQLRYKAFESEGAAILLPELMVEPEEESRGEGAAPAPTAPLMIRVAEVAALSADEWVEPVAPNSFSLSVDGVPLTVVVEERRHLARIISPLFPVAAYAGDLMEATNHINAEHIAFGYTYVRDGEVRYAAEVVIEPFHADVIPVALKAAASVVRGLRMEVDELTSRWTRFGE